MVSSPNAFTRRRRLPSKADFDRVFSHARIRLTAHPFLLLAAESVSLESRIGMVVGKRNAKRAVDRNRVRRHIRESFRLLHLPCALDVVILARPGAGLCDGPSLAASLDQLWARLALKLENRSKTDEISPGG